MYESAITEIMRPIKTSINVSHVFAFLDRRVLIKKALAIRMYPGCYRGNEPCSEAMVHIDKPDHRLHFQLRNCMRNRRGLSHC